MHAPREPSHLLAANSPVGLNGVLGKELAETKQVQERPACNHSESLVTVNISRHDAILLGQAEHDKGHAKPQLRESPRQTTKPHPQQVGLEDGGRVAHDFWVAVLDQVQERVGKQALIANEHGADVVVHTAQAFFHVLRTPDQAIQQRCEQRRCLGTQQGDDVRMADPNRLHAIVVASSVCTHSEQVLEDRPSGLQSALLNCPNQWRHRLVADLDLEQDHFALPARCICHGRLQFLGGVLVDRNDHRCRPLCQCPDENPADQVQSPPKPIVERLIWTGFLDAKHKRRDKRPHQVLRDPMTRVK
mmetsp:Transcript_7502/g.17846  ORF Transcript_7502/g.17846 Transcript_7502/m.17846 type:complete len:303 (-) Transcript_7502:979-1887(-)